jgi:effector-binding domain-containing protein
MRELPAVETMATSVQVGDPQLIFVAFGALGKWIEANDYQIAGPYREIGFELSETGIAQEMVVEVQLPVVKTSGSAGPFPGVRG